MTTSMGDHWCDEQTRADNAAQAYDDLYDATLPRVLSERKQAIRDALRVPNADVYEVLKGKLGDEVVMQRLEALIVRAAEGDSFGQIGVSIFNLTSDLIDAAARDGLEEAVAKECAERAR